MEDVASMVTRSNGWRQRPGLWAPVIIWAVLIFLLSSLTAPQLGSLPLFPHADKLGHLVLFGVLGLLIFRGISGSTGWTGPTRFALTLGIVLVYASLDEAHQAFVPGRSPEVFDLAADLGGALVFSAAWWRWTSRRGARS